MNIPMIDVEATGLKIVMLMDRYEISVKQLQEILGFSTPQAIYKWRWGKTLPTLDNLVVLARIFNVSMDDIVVVK